MKVLKKICSKITIRSAFLLRAIVGVSMSIGTPNLCFIYRDQVREQLRDLRACEWFSRFVTGMIVQGWGGGGSSCVWGSSLNTMSVFSRR